MLEQCCNHLKTANLTSALTCHIISQSAFTSEGKQILTGIIGPFIRGKIRRVLCTYLCNAGGGGGGGGGGRA